MLGVSAALFTADGVDVAEVAHYCKVPSRRALFGVMRVMASAESGFRRASQSSISEMGRGAVLRDESVIRSKIVRFAKRVQTSRVRPYAAAQ